jgi:outer membrane protein assembly factor BamB
MTRKLLLTALLLTLLYFISSEREKPELPIADKATSKIYSCPIVDLHLVENKKRESEEDTEVSSEEYLNIVIDPVETSEKTKDHFVIEHTEIPNISFDLFLNDAIYSELYYDPTQIFPERYTELDGVLTFRGNHLRNSPSYGKAIILDKKLEVSWSFTTSVSTWGGGAGWTGQPAIVRWPKETRQIMNLSETSKTDDSLVEVIYASLDGHVYFLNLESGKQTRKPIHVINPIKGSLSIDPRGYPLLYVGEGIPENKSIGFNIFSLIDHSRLYYVDGLDSLAFRRWGAFDSSALINKNTDTLLLGGENGLLYQMTLNTTYDPKNKSITVDPVPLKYRYKIKDNPYQGIENSVTAYKNLLFFADNGGNIQGINLMTMQPVWTLTALDDTDATITLEVEDDIPFLFTGTEVDHQGVQGYAYLRKINGLTGELVWQVKYKCESDPKVNGGMLATPVLGKEDTSHLVIFTLARYNQFNAGLMVALDRKTGEEVWSWNMPSYAWSSPVDIYDHEGNTYLIQSDSEGNMHLIEGPTGNLLHKINLGANIEASPAIFEDTIVVATRAHKIFGIKIK